MLPSATNWSPLCTLTRDQSGQMMVSGGKKSPPSEIVAMCKAGGVHGQLNFGDSKADAAGWDSIQQGEIQGREREREREIWHWWPLLPRWQRRSQPRHLANVTSGEFLNLYRGWMSKYFIIHHLPFPSLFSSP